MAHEARQDEIGEREGQQDADDQRQGRGPGLDRLDVGLAHNGALAGIDRTVRIVGQRAVGVVGIVGHALLLDVFGSGGWAPREGVRRRLATHP